MNSDDVVFRQQEHWKRAAEGHAGTPQAVGSESVAHKWLRYEKVAELFGTDRDFTVHDVGAGVGDFCEFLTQRFGNRGAIYSASEITETYCELARERFPGVEFHHRNILKDQIPDRYDYVVLSGVFHQRGEVGLDEWAAYMEELLVSAYALATKGMAFNVLSHWADYHNPENYYANLAEVQAFVVGRLSRFFRMDHTYPLFEATFHVYTGDHVRQRYTEPEFAKYLK